MSVSRYDTLPQLVALAVASLRPGDALAVSEHLDWMRSAGRSAGTISDRTRLLIRLAGWLATLDPPRSLLEASADDLAAWQRSIGRMAVESVSTYLGHARGFYLWLARFRHVPDVTGLLTRPRKPRHLPRPIPDESLRTALRTADGPLLVALLLMAMCGLRVGEVARLLRRDIRDADRPPVVVVTGKGDRTRIVRMPDGLAHQLRLAGLPLLGHVIVGADGRAVTANRISQIANAHLHDLGIPETAHSLRHWYGTHVYRHTQDLRLTQEMLGHSSPTTTAGYAAYAPARADEMAADLDMTMLALLGRPVLRSVRPPDQDASGAGRR